MLAKQFKLNLREDKDFFSSCKKKHSPYFSFFYKKNDDGMKIAVIVPKKIVKLATKRNEIKRKVYSSIELIKTEEKNIDLVIVVNKKSIDESKSNLVKTIESSLIEITR